ncbi:MAG: NAD-dependent epimerase/dehydratase family protein [Bacilli bacterium]
MSKFLVTGGAGFIGSEICHLLISLNHEVTVLDNLSSGHLENINDLLHFDSFHFIKGDISDFQVCLKASKDVSYIIHQAALVSVPRSIEEPLLNNETNITGFVNILEAARINHVKKVVYASSSAVYGDNQDEIKTEERLGNVLSPYALSKKTNEEYAHLYQRLYNLATVGLRYFNVYGEKQDPSSVYSGVISIFFKKALEKQPLTIYGNGLITRDFVNVLDVAKANLLACLCDKAENGVYNIGTGNQVTIKDLALLVLKVMDLELPINYRQARVGDILFSCADVDKAKNDLGFVANISLEDGLKQMAQHLKK